MEWNKQGLRVLIHAYSEERGLYDPHHPLYHSKVDRKEKLAIIGEKVRAVLPEVTDDDCKYRFTSLRSHYCVEIKKIKASEKSGTGAVYRPTVWWFPHMDFLRDHVTPRQITQSYISPQSPLSVGSSGSNFHDISSVEKMTVPVELYSEEDNSNYSQEVFTVGCTEDSMSLSTPRRSRHSPPMKVYASASKRHKRDNEDELVTSTLSVLKDIQVASSASNEDDKLGQYLAAELKKMTNPAIKAETKIKVMKAIMDGIQKHVNS